MLAVFFGAVALLLAGVELYELLDYTLRQHRLSDAAVLLQSEVRRKARHRVRPPRPLAVLTHYEGVPIQSRL
jgi:hypothetical protein